MSSVVDDGDILSLTPLPQSAAGEDRHLEVEVKFMLRDLAPIRGRLVDMGAEIIAPRVFERNVRFDTADEALLARQQLLRLRQDTRVRLTFKGPAAEDVASEAKVREEIELEVGHFDRMSAVLQRLGFLPIQVYEKYRETYQWRGVEIVLDEMPFGDFIELEGVEADLRPAAEALGLDWSRRILANYLALMELCRRSFNLPFSDLTFENFAGLSVDMGELLPISAL
ncbi:MAG TPA: class IV adenylate cyclase [Promineifilum sp.]|nr:class IV adenylate cyclase [Promineifilum sp.]HRO92217.1 class IV adenylate cyclase [Promineifilum sp.]HRQ14450.1 class IV adenylate cyclase [Promineifilum sp.]